MSLDKHTDGLDLTLPLMTRNLDHHVMKKTEPASNRMPELTTGKNHSHAEIGLANISSTFSPLSASCSKVDARLLLQKQTSQQVENKSKPMTRRNERVLNNQLNSMNNLSTQANTLNNLVTPRQTDTKGLSSYNMGNIKESGEIHRSSHRRRPILLNNIKSENASTANPTINSSPKPASVLRQGFAANLTPKFNQGRNESMVARKSIKSTRSNKARITHKSSSAISSKDIDQTSFFRRQGCHI